jgi:hypothetical protein
MEQLLTMLLAVDGIKRIKRTDYDERGSNEEYPTGSVARIVKVNGEPALEIATLN